MRWLLLLLAGCATARVSEQALGVYAPFGDIDKVVTVHGQPRQDVELQCLGDPLVLTLDEHGEARALITMPARDAHVGDCVLIWPQ